MFPLVSSLFNSAIVLTNLISGACKKLFELCEFGFQKHVYQYEQENKESSGLRNPPKVNGNAVRSDLYLNNCEVDILLCLPRKKLERQICVYVF